MTYRQGGHSRADPGTYRPDDEVQEWLARDPIPLYRERLIAAGVDGSVLDEVDRAAERDVEAAVEEARAAPPPDPAVLATELWAEGGSAWRN